jgi:hypothetical protein
LVHALQDEGNVWHMAAQQSAAISSAESRRANGMNRESIDHDALQ